MVRLFGMLFCLLVIVYASTFNTHLKKAKRGNIYSEAYVGIMYYKGKEVTKNLDLAFMWLHTAASSGNNMARNWLSKMYYEGAGVEKNFLAAYKWAMLSYKNGDKNAKSIIKFLKPKVSFYIEKRYKKLANTPSYKKSFGLIFGTVFPDELINIYYDGYNQDEKIKYILKKIKINYAKKSYKIFDKVNVKLTPVSHTLYALQAIHYFNTDKECNSFMQKYIKNLSKGDIKKARDINGESVVYIDFGVSSSPTTRNSLYNINDIEKLKGIRHILRCSGTVGEINIIDFSTKELAIAEAVEKEPFFNEYFGKEIEVRADYMSPFGLTFLKPFRSQKRLNIKPPKPSSMFSVYNVNSSKLTNTLYGISAIGSFENEDRCKVAIGSTIVKFMNSYQKRNHENNQYWNKIYGGVVSTFFINEKGVVENLKNGVKMTKELLKVRMGCEKTNSRKWKGWINIYSEYGRKIAEIEDRLLTEERW